MKIIFKNIRWKNFLSTGNSFTEIDFIKHKSNLVIGANGSGKSTMMDALCFCLFGKAYRDINKSDLINTINNKELLVECEFTVSNVNYKIQRGQKPNIFKIFVNDVLLPQSAQSGDQQEYLENTILNGWNLRTFKQIVVIGNANYVPFMQQSASVRRDMVEELLDIKIFTSMATKLKDKMTQTKTSLSDKEKDIANCKNNIDSMNILIDTIKINNKLVIEEKEKQITDLLDKEKSLQKQIKLIDEAITLLSKEIDSSKKKKLEDALRKMDMKEREIEVLKDHLKKQNKFFETNEMCPTCMRDIDECYKKEIVTSIVDDIKTQDNFLDQIEAKYMEMNSKLKQFNEKEKELDKLQNEKKSIKNKIEIITGNIEYIKKDINKLNEKNKFNSVDMALINEQKEQLKVFESEKEEFLKEKNAEETILSFLKDGGIKTQIIKQNIPVLNKLINKYLAAMDFFVNFEIDEQFNETIKSRFRDTFKYSSFSEGEKLRIDLSILFAWRFLAKMRNSLNSNLLILDEIFESSLDSNGTDELLKILKELDEDTKVFIISHKSDQLFDKFDNVIKFEKHQSFSRMV